ncbi:hypothetical protein VNI00_005534 [Paramarasmius palmivorus]|uniref:STB6-like N-terminal domain-containing protein n=1 Tax=Paramarasmius palmivorus TaxID=297713 RepID=A0AAW0DDK9_9AGAR
MVKQGSRRSFETIPNEILTQIATLVIGQRERARLSRSCKRFQAIVKPMLYDRATFKTATSFENFSRTIMTSDRNLANLVKEFHLVLISALENSYESRSLVTLINTVLLRLERLRDLRILLEVETPDHIQLCLSHCTFPDLATFYFGLSCDMNAFGVLEFLKRHTQLKHVTIETRQNFHNIIVPVPGERVALLKLKSYSGPLNFLDHIATDAIALESIVIKMTLDGSSIPQPNIPEQQLNALEKVRDRGKGLSLAFEASFTAHFILDLVSRMLPELSSLVIFSRNGDLVAINASNQFSHQDVERTALYFARLRALKRFTYYDPPAFKLAPKSQQVEEDVKKLSKMCPSLQEISLCIQLNGFQLYAVQPWILQRRKRPFLVVHTGDSSHRISVVAGDDDDTEDNQNTAARPKHTPYGTLLVTSLAHFRSDYTILPIPDGEFDRVKDQLYTNIGLQRLGISGRSALTLEEPSDTTKERFVNAYHMVESTKTETLFTPSVLELIKLIQASLIVFGYYNGPIDGLMCDASIEGICSWLADVGSLVGGLDTTSRTADPSTVAGLLSLLLAVRNRLVGLSSHNHNSVPKDPFLHPQLFLASLRSHCAMSQSPHTLSHQHTYSMPNVPTIHSLALKSQSPPTNLAPSNDTPTILTRSLVESIFSAYDAKVLKGSRVSISNAYKDRNDDESKSKLPLPISNLHFPRALPLPTGAKDTPSNAAASILVPTADLPEFIHAVVGRKRLEKKEKEREKEKDKEKEKREKEKERGEGRRDSVDSEDGLSPSTAIKKVRASKPKLKQPSKDIDKESGVGGVAGTVRGLWSGNVLLVARLRERIAERDNDRKRQLERELEDKEKSDDGMGPLLEEKVERKGTTLWSDGDTDYNDRPGFRRTQSAHPEKSDGRSTEEEGAGGGIWGMGTSRVRGKIESWTGISKIDNRLSKTKRTPKSSISHSVNGSLGNIVDLSSTTPGNSLSSRKGGRLLLPAFGESSKNASGVSTPLPLADGQRSPLLPPFGEGDDDDLLSSGQVSPVSDDPRTPKSFAMWNAKISPPISRAGSAAVPMSKKDSVGGVSLSSSTNSKYTGLGLKAVDSKLEELSKTLGAGKRPWSSRMRPFTANRITSWSDPVSARGKHGEDVISADDEDDLREEGPNGSAVEESDLDDPSGGFRRRRRRRQGADSGLSSPTRVRVLSESGRLVGEPEEYDHSRQTSADSRGSRESRGRSRNRDASPGLFRRRSFHTLSTYRHCRVLPVDKMRIDVELAGYHLIMYRRETHLKNVLTTLQMLTSRLTTTSSHLRTHYEEHLNELSELEARGAVIAEIEKERAGISQATNTLLYEGQQFRVPELWHSASPPYQKVLEYRDQIYGSHAGGKGKRKLAEGVRGAHGPYNRPQWRLDGSEVLVDAYGRTESDVEEESKVGEDFFRVAPREDEGGEELVEHPAMKPMWLLRFFTRWGARWGTGSGAAAAKATTSEPTDIREDTVAVNDNSTKSRSSLPAPEKAKSL